MSAPHPPRVFLSYSHDSDQHGERVLALANHLRTDGIDCQLDQYVVSPPEGWPRWMERQLAEADFVLMICTATYARRVRGEETAGTGLGVRWEGHLSYQYFYIEGTLNTKFIPVLLEGASPVDIPLPFQVSTYYRTETQQGYEALYRHLTGQPLTPKPEIGALRKLLPRPRRSTGMTGTPDLPPSATVPPHAPTKETRSSFNYEYIYIQTQVEQFELQDYIQNPPMIKKLHEDKEKIRAYSSNLGEELREELSNRHKLELQNNEFGLKLKEANHVNEELRKNLKQIGSELSKTQNNLKHLQEEKNKVEIELAGTKRELHEAHRNSLIQFTISITATVITAIGVNLITTTPNDWKSWLFIITGIILSCIAFFIVRRSR